MAALGNRIARLLYPEHAVCLACGALRVDDASIELCRACAAELLLLEGPFCPRCGKPGWAMLCPDCLIKPKDALDGKTAAFAYGGTARSLIRALKYNNVEPAARALSAGMARVMPRDRFDALVPVPLHRAKQRRRGFNQAHALCVCLSRETGLPVLDALSRRKPTKTQTRLTREARMQNVKGAFAATPSVAGLSLLLVDDVLTTGSTAVACAETLKAVGAANVWLLTAARATMHTHD